MQNLSLNPHRAWLHRIHRIFPVSEQQQRSFTAMANYIHVPEGAPEVPKLDVTLDEHDYRAGALKLIKTLRPHWKPSEVKMKVISFLFAHDSGGRTPTLPAGESQHLLTAARLTHYIMQKAKIIVLRLQILSCVTRWTRRHHGASRHTAAYANCQSTHVVTLSFITIYCSCLHACYNVFNVPFMRKLQQQ